MKPVAYHVPWVTNDLTAGYFHRITDGDSVRYVVIFPKTWEKQGERQTVQLAGKPGETISIQNYKVTSWEEQEFKPMPAPPPEEPA